MTKHRFDAPVYNRFRGQNDFFSYQNQYETRGWQPPINSYEQPQTSPFGELPHHLNQMMGHVGTITNGVNMMRQIGGLFSLFR